MLLLSPSPLRWQHHRCCRPWSLGTLFVEHPSHPSTMRKAVSESCLYKMQPTQRSTVQRSSNPRQGTVALWTFCQNTIRVPPASSPFPKVCPLLSAGGLACAHPTLGTIGVLQQYVKLQCECGGGSVPEAYAPRCKVPVGGGERLLAGRRRFDWAGERGLPACSKLRYSSVCGWLAIPLWGAF